MTGYTAQLDSNGNHHTYRPFHIKYSMYFWATVLVMVGVVSIIVDAIAWQVVFLAFSGAIVLCFAQPNRETQVAEQLRQEVGETAEMDLRTFRLRWNNQWKGGRCEFSSLEFAGKAARRLLEGNEAEGHIECYEMIDMEEVGQVPTCWRRWNAQKRQWDIEWCENQSDIGGVTMAAVSRKRAEFEEIVRRMMMQD